MNEGCPRQEMGEGGDGSERERFELDRGEIIRRDDAGNITGWVCRKRENGAILHSIDGTGDPIAHLALNGDLQKIAELKCSLEGFGYRDGDQVWLGAPYNRVKEDMQLWDDLPSDM